MAALQDSEPLLISREESHEADTAITIKIHCESNSETGQTTMNRLEDHLVLVVVGEPSLHNEVLVQDKKETNN